MTPRESELLHHYQKLRGEIVAYCGQKKIPQLLAVSKNYPLEDIVSLHRLTGHEDFGENKVQELVLKSSLLPQDLSLKWHFIGRLQKNKISKLLSIRNLHAIHSIDTQDLLQMVATKWEEKFMQQKDFILNLFLQIKTSTEEEKQGFLSTEDVESSIDWFQKQKFQGSKIVGLMTMAPIRGEDLKTKARNSFQQLRKIKSVLQNTLGVHYQLSMGMSSDYLLAIDFESDFVRIGSRIFG